MTIKELKEYIKDLPDDMKVYKADTTSSPYEVDFDEPMLGIYNYTDGREDEVIIS
jgi:hypothetical protein